MLSLGSYESSILRIGNLHCNLLRKGTLFIPAGFNSKYTPNSRTYTHLESRHHESRSILAVNVGLAANTILAALKTTIGVVGHSPALLADGINSTSDVAYYVIVRIFMGIARRPADEQHPYGHRQMESIAALVVGAFVITTAFAIFWDAISKIYDLWSGQGMFTGATLGALIVAIGTVLLKIILTTFTLRIGKQTKNSAVFALAYDHRNDIFAALAASIGIFLGRMGFVWVDPLAGAIVALVILRTGIEIMRQSSGDLMDTVPGAVLRKQIEELLQRVLEIQEIEEVLAHRFGPYLVVNVTLGVDGSITVTEGDAIATQVEELLYREVDLLQRVHVHYHPVNTKSTN
jgi:cation diffusion facilitator family transporter